VTEGCGWRQRAHVQFGIEGKTKNLTGKQEGNEIMKKTF
jgi:hypothetical protein